MAIEVDVDEEFTPEEIALMEQDTAPPPDRDEEALEPAPEVEPAPAIDPDKAPALDLESEPKPEATTETDTDPERPADQKNSAGFEAFMAKNKDKSPEELAQLAYNATASRTEARETAKQANDRLQSVANSIKTAREARQLENQKRIDEYNELLETDPDAATRMLHQQKVEDEETAASNEENKQYRAEQMATASKYIPDFDVVAPKMWEFGVKTLGYTPQELHNVSDHRDLVMLDCANRFFEAVSSGVLDRTGKYLGPPQGQPQNNQGQQPAQQQIETQPAQDAQIARVANAQSKSSNSLGNQRNQQNAGRSLKAQANDIINMDDDDFDKISDSDLNKILQSLDT